jgi:hypothetical protein
MNSWVLYGTSTSLDNDMDHGNVFYKFHTMVLLLVRGLVALFREMSMLHVRLFSARNESGDIIKKCAERYRRYFQ